MKGSCCIAMCIMRGHAPIDREMYGAPIPSARPCSVLNIMRVSSRDLWRFSAAARVPRAPGPDSQGTVRRPLTFIGRVQEALSALSGTVSCTSLMSKLRAWARRRARTRCVRPYVRLRQYRSRMHSVPPPIRVFRSMCRHLHGEMYRTGRSNHASSSAGWPLAKLSPSRPRTRSRLRTTSRATSALQISTAWTWHPSSSRTDGRNSRS